MAKSVKKTTAKKDTSSTTVNTRRVVKDTSKINPEFTDAFINEVDEDVKNDNFKALWNKYGIFVILFVILTVSATVSFEKIKSWKVAQNQANTENYMIASQLRENPEQTLAALQKISNDNQGIFSDFAKLQIANVLFNLDKTDEALLTLQNLIKDESVGEEVRHIALIKLATYKVDTISRQELEMMLKPLLDENTSWSPLAQDLLAMAAIRDGDVETAQNIYENILKIKDLPENFKTKIQDMLASLGNM